MSRTSTDRTSPELSVVSSKVRAVTTLIVTTRRLQHAADLQQHLEEQHMTKWRDVKVGRHMRKLLVEAEVNSRAKKEAGRVEELSLIHI